MAKLIALIQFFLCLPLLFYVPPSVQVPNIRLELYTMKKVVQRIDGAKTAINYEFSHNAPQAKSIRKLGAREEAQADGSYFVRIGVGTPPKQYYTTLDTQVDLTWIQCNPCPECYKQTDPVFNPLGSTSYKPLPCASGNCPQMPSSSRCNSATQTCLYEIEYVDGSGSEGEFVTETLSFQSIPIADILIGCAHSTKGDFYGGYSSGIFGIGRGSPFLSQAKYTAFAYCIAHKNSSKQSFLEFDSSAAFEDSLFTTALLKNYVEPALYYVPLTGISVNNQVVAIPPLDPRTGHGGAIVGLGTGVTRFPQEVYNQVRDVFLTEATGFTVVSGSVFFDACALTAETETNFPTVEFLFGPQRLPLPRENVMVYTGNYICFGFAPTDLSFSTIGNYQQQGIRVNFDLDNHMLGFLPSNC